MKAIWDYNKNFSINRTKDLGNTFTHPWASGIPKLIGQYDII